MEHKPIKSTNLESVAYDEASKTMHIKFVGTGHTYEYEGVTPEQHQALLNSYSPGTHFAKHIRSRIKGRKL